MIETSNNSNIHKNKNKKTKKQTYSLYFSNTHKNTLSKFTIKGKHKSLGIKHQINSHTRRRIGKAYYLVAVLSIKTIFKNFQRIVLKKKERGEVNM